ncbi:hypothetical protein GW756_03560 [bacterium]|nr:hypothetical protein [bacterium]NCQ55404.1 hypothetical protein [Candidatus Parcubacteria bacterium]NCS67766.1 hypothetical protein [Candidatus Peregrinibacteria bacterium]NCS96420.1 hypothetical protein [bacterium]
MTERLFGFDSSALKLNRPNTDDLEAEMERTFGSMGYHSSMDFSLTLDA